MREIGSIYVGDAPKLMGGGYRGHDAEMANERVKEQKR